MNPVLSLNYLLTYCGIAIFLEIKKSIDMGVPELTQLQRERIACVMVRRQYVKDFRDQENAYLHSSEYRQIWTSPPYSF